MERLYSMWQTAETVGIGRQSIHYHITQGHITVHSVNARGHYRFTEAEVNRLKAHVEAQLYQRQTDFVSTVVLAERLGIRAALLATWVKRGLLTATPYKGKYLWSKAQEAAAVELVREREQTVRPTPGRAKPERRVEEDIDGWQEAEWRRYGFELVAQRERLPHCYRAHGLVPVRVGTEHALLCGLCNRVYLTGKVAHDDELDAGEAA